jgi:hypothetical protein
MSFIASSEQTLAAGAAGNWFTPAGLTWVLDVDTPGGCVILRTRHGSGDTAPKLVRVSLPNNDPEIEGAQSILVNTGVIGRQFQVVNVGTVAVVVRGDQ